MRAAAYHEAGHVVVGRVLGLVPVCAAIAGEHGQSAFVANPGHTWAALRDQIIVLMVGGEAERECSLGWGGDLDDMLEIRRTLGEAGLLELEPRLRSQTGALVRPPQ